MSECRRFESMLGGSSPAQIDTQEVALLLAHAQECEDCRRLLATHADLVAAAARVPEPEEAELDARQERTLRTIRTQRSGHPLRVAAIAAIAAGVIVAFAAGLLAGRSTVGHAGRSRLSARLIAGLRAEAAANRDLDEVEDSPFTYSNVSFREAGGDRVALDFDVTTHLGVVDSPRSPLVREVLAQSLLNPASVGERLKAMSFAASELEPKLRQAIVFALGHDESVAVRLAALSALAGGRQDPTVQAALMTALRDDASMQVRLAALDALVRHRVEHRRIRDAIREEDRPGDQALMVRLAELERKP